jgi:hypothetical protein
MSNVYGPTYGELICQIDQLWQSMQTTKDLSSETLARFKAQLTALTREVEATVQPPEMLEFLRLPRARLEQLELLLRIVTFSARIKPLPVPTSLEQTEGWSLLSLQKFQDTARAQVGQLQRVPHHAVPEDAAYFLSDKLFVAMTNQSELANLHSKLRAQRAQDSSADARLPGVTLMTLLRSARAVAEKKFGLDFSSMRLARDGGLDPNSHRLVMAVHDWDLVLVDSEMIASKDFPKAFVVPVSSRELRPAFNVDPNHSTWTNFLQAVMLSANIAAGPDFLQPKATIEEVLLVYDKFDEELTAERARFMSAVLGVLLEFAESLVEYFAQNFPTVFQGHTQTQPSAAQRILSWIGSASIGGAIKRVQAFKAQVQGQAKPNDSGSATSLEALNVSIAKNLTEKSKGQKPARDQNPQWDLVLTNSMNVARSAVAFLFLPHLLFPFLAQLDKFVRQEADAPVQQLAVLFAPFFMLMPNIQPEATDGLPHNSLFEHSEEEKKDEPDVLRKLELRHWAGKSACQAVEYVRDGPGFTSPRPGLKAFGKTMAEFHSDYVFSEFVRNELKDRAVQAPEPEQLEVLLLDALGRDPSVATTPDLQNEFELVRQALEEHSAWGTLLPPSPEYFQERPCELLRVRGLDLSLVPEVVSGPRGVRVLMPLDAESPNVNVSEESYVRLAQQALTPYLLSVLKSSPAFMQQWRSLVDQYARHSAARASFMRRCVGDLASVRDLSFD